jgi:hypothetical protein
MKTNDFYIDLQYSLDLRTHEAFNKFYFSYFAGLQRVETIDYETQPELQLSGIDKIIHFSNGATATIDEKKRRVDYGDIYLELWSNYTLKRLGWIYTATCDYIVYFIEPSQKVYVLPLLLLQSALRKHRKAWTCEHGIKRYFHNGIIKSVGLTVPPEELLNAIQQQMADNYNI